ncbi:MAG: hypothetical protein AAF654_03910 [Myxococcota bacterium]
MTVSPTQRIVGPAPTPALEPRALAGALAPSLPAPAPLPQPYRVTQAAGDGDLAPPPELQPPQDANRRPSTVVRGQLQQAFSRLAEQDVDLGGGPVDVSLSIPRDNELTRPQRDFLRDNPGLTIARTELEITPSQAVDLGVPVSFTGKLIMRVDVPIELFPNGNELNARATYELLKRRATEWVTRGLPNLSGATMSGETWPIGARLEVRLGAGVSIGSALGVRGGRDVILRAERRTLDRVSLVVGSERSNGLFGSTSVSDAHVGGAIDSRRLVESTYEIDDSDPAHMEALGQLLQWRNGIPRVDVSALDALPDGEIRQAFDNDLIVGPNIRLPTPNVTYRGSQRTRKRQSGWIVHPRSVDGVALGSDGLAERIAAIRSGDIEVIRSTPVGTELLTRQQSGLNWSVGLTGRYSDPILDQFLSVGGELRIDHQDHDIHTVQQRVRFTEQGVHIDFEVFEREQIRDGIRARLGVELGPAVRDYFRDEHGLDVDADLALDLLWNDPEALAAGVGLEAFNAFEDAVNSVLDALAVRTEYTSERETFSGQRLTSIPLDPNDPVHADFIQFALSGAPIDAVLAEVAARRTEGIELYPVRRTDTRQSETERFIFQALALQLSLTERTAETRQLYEFRTPEGQRVILDGRQIGHNSERVGLLETVEANFQAYTATQVEPTERVIDSGIVAGFEFDDNRVSRHEIDVLTRLPGLLGLTVEEFNPGRWRDPFTGWGTAEGSSTFSINQQGLSNAIVARDFADEFVDAAMMLHADRLHWSRAEAHGPAAFSFDIAELVRASRQSGYANADARAARARQEFAERYPELDLLYMQSITRVSTSLERATESAQSILGRTHPNHGMTYAEIRHDVGHAMLARIAIDYRDEQDQEERKTLRRRYRRISADLGRPDPDLSFHLELEKRRERVADIFSSSAFVGARTRIEAGEHINVEELERLLDEGLRAILDESSVGNFFVSNEFYALALWVAIARAAGLENVQAVLRVEPGRDDGFRIVAGEDFEHEQEIDALLDEARRIRE